MRIITICCLLLASFLANISAQITLEIQDVSTCQNTVSVPIVILEDEVLTSIQFTLVWDGRNGTGLSYDGITDMIGNGSFSLGPNDPTTGSPNEVDTLTYTWFNPTGHSFTAGDQLLTLDLNIGTSGETYPVVFYPGPNPPTPAEATAPGFVPVTVATLDGEVSTASNTPTFVDCPTAIMVANTDGTCSNLIIWTPPTVVDCDNNANPPTSNFSPGDPFTIGSQVVNYTVTDMDGNTATCSFNVTVTDGASPLVSCPANINETVPVGTTYTATSTELMPTITDCSTTTINFTLSGSTTNSGIYNGQDLTFNPGTTQVMYSVSDGINPPTDCSFTVVINEISGAGITLDIGDVTTSCDDDISVPVIILEDQDITSIEFTIIWGQPGLTFNNLTSNLPGGLTNIGPFATPPHNGGADTITYSYANFNPLSLTAGQTIATLNFTPTGNTGDVIPVLFYPGTSHPEFPVPAEASDASFNPILPVNTLNGSITIGGSNQVTIDCPASITISCEESITLANTGTATATDACGLSLSPMFSDVNNLSECSNTGTIIRTFMATDGNGNMNSCTQTITIIDSTDPVFDSNPATIANIDCGIDFPTQEILTASDNCGNATVVPSVDPFTPNCDGYTITYRWTATDDCGNTTETTQSFQVNPDNVDPVFDSNPTAIANIDCGGNLPTQEVLTASDNCGNATVVPSVDPFTPDCDGYTITYRWTATDDCGNTTETTQSFDVNPDNLNPVFDSNPATIANIDCGIDFPTQEILTASDNCGNATVVPSVDPFTPDCEGYTITYRWTATDDCGNTAEITQSFGVNPDNTDPNFTVPLDITIGCEDDPNDLSLVGDVTDEEDNCDTDVSNNGLRSATFTDNIDPSNCNTLIVRTWTLTDLCGNQNIQTQNIQLIDNTNPVAMCQQNFELYLDNNGTVTLDPENLNNGSTDNCSTSLIYTASQADFDCADLGNQTVTLTVEDDCGNESTCDAMVSIIDNISPTLTCIGDITQSTTNPSEVINNIGLVNFNDNCGIAEINYTLTGATTGSGMGDDASGTIFNTGQTIVTYTATDNSGNTNTCSFTINLQGAVSIECPPFITLDAAPGSCDLEVDNIAVTILSNPQNISSIVYELSGATIGSGTGDASGTSFNVGTTQVTYMVMDDVGNSTACGFSITIIDAENPTFTTGCPEDITGSVGNDCQQIVNWVSPVAADNCPGVTLTSTHQPGDSFGPGETIVVYTATDLEGNTNSCSFSITLTDDSPPMVECPEDVVTNSPDENPVIVNDIAPISFGDNCSGSIITYSLTGALTGSGFDDASGTAFPVGQTTVLYTITDGSNLSSTCSFTITIQGSINIACPEEVTSDAGADCTQVIDNIPVDIISNPANITSIFYELTGATTGSGSDASGVSFNLGTTVVTYMVNDNLNNTASCSFMVNIIDNSNPTISCPGNVTVNTTNGAPVVVSDIGPLSTGDNCFIQTINYVLTGATSDSGMNDASGTSFAVGETTVTYTITDASGNESSCDFIVLVNDEMINENLIECPEDILLEVDAGLCSNTIEEIAPIIIIEPSNLQSLAWTLSGATTGNGNDFIENITFNAGVTEVTFTAISNDGEMDVCIFSVTIVDNVNPIITGPTSFEFSSDIEACGTIPEFNITITDNCEINEISYILSGALNELGVGIPTNLFLPVGITTLTITATDFQGNSENYVAEIEVIDDINPIATCPEDLTLPVDMGSCQATLENIEGMKFDNCAVANDRYQISGATIASNLESLNGIMLNVGENLVDFEIIDVNGNTHTCGFTITVIDEQAPIIQCPENVITSLTTGQASVEVENIDPIEAIDLCSDFLISYNITGATSENGTVTASGTAFNLGVSEVSYSIMDVAGNSASCTFTVTVENLSITCPDNQEVVIPTDACEVTLDDLLPTTPNNDANITYEITGATIGSGNDDASGTTFNPGISTITYTITDDFNHQASCSFTITVLDEQAPEITCPSLPVFLTDEGVCMAFIPFEILQPLTNQDNCGPTSPVEFEISGTLNGSGIITDIPLAYPIGTAIITYTVSDINGNSSSCSFNIEIVDNLAPTIQCPDDLEITIPAGSTSTTVDNTDPSVFDNCGISEISYNLEGATNSSGLNNLNAVEILVGTTLVTYTATDLSGNENTCSFSIIVVEDGVIDLINCPIDQVSSTSPDICSSTIMDIAPNLLVPASEIESITFSISGSTILTGMNDASGTSFNQGVSTVTYTATSANQEFQTICSFMVTILDQEAPTWSACPLNLNVGTTGENCSAVVAWEEPIAMDNCGEFTIERDMEPGSVFPIGNTIVNYTATDASGNSSICEINITVIDETPPTTEECPSDITIASAGESCGAVYNFTPPIFTDNCSEVTVVSSHESGELFPIGSTIVSITATDEQGNDFTCAFMVTVVDETPPVLTCPEDIIINADGSISNDPNNIIESTQVGDDCESVFINFNDPSVIDNCTNTTVTLTGIEPGEPFSGTTILTYEATDENGNTAESCEFSVTILETPGIPVVVNPSSACLGSSVTLSTEPITGATYIWEGPNGFTATGNTIFIEDLMLEDVGLYEVRTTLSNDCTIESSGVVELSETPVISNLTSNSPLCVGEDLNLSLAGNNFSTVTWEGPNNFTSNSENLIIESITTDLSGFFTATVTSDDGCSSTQMLEVEVNGVPNAPTIQTDCASSICLGESCLLIGTAYASDVIYIWDSESGTAGLPANTNNNEIVIIPTEPGTYTYQYSVEINGCESSISEYTLIVDNGPEATDDLVQVNYQGTIENIVVLANDIINSELGMSVNLLRIPENGNVTQNGDDTFTYTPNLDFIGVDEFTYQVCYVCSGDLVCDEAVVSVNVAYTGNCDVPNVITPNGDNQNDVLFLPCITGDDFPNNELVIYNQWGDEVFRQAPYQNQWDGTLDGEAGKDLPDGTYFFIFLQDRNSNPIKGHITIYR